MRSVPLGSRRLVCTTIFLTVTRLSVAADLLPADQSPQAVIDYYVSAKIAAAGVTAAAAADDATFLRRLTLDLAGRIPTPRELEEFTQSTRPTKREEWIDRFVNSHWYVRQMASVLNGILRGSGNDGPDLQDYLLVAVRERRGWNQMFCEMLGVASADLKPERFVQGRVNDLDLLTRDVSSIFFGINISCSQCHVHPYIESLTQDHFFGMRAFFSRSYAFEDRLFERQFSNSRVKFTTSGGENREVGLMFLTGLSVDTPAQTIEDLPKAIADEQKTLDDLKKRNEENKKKTEKSAIEYPLNAEFSYRAQLVEVALKTENQHILAKSLVNRLWHRLFGYGLVMRIDQMHDENHASHPQLLDWLARDLMDNKFDFHRIVRGIVSSQTYARSSHPLTADRPSRELFAVANLRPLTPRQFGMSILIAGDDSFDEDGQSLTVQDEKIAVLEGHANQLFGDLIEQPYDDMQVNAIEALRMSNDPERLNAIGEKLSSKLQGAESRPKQIEMAFLNILSRLPTKEESTRVDEFLAEYERSSADKKDDDSKPQVKHSAWQQVLWALTTSPEFRFNH